ncbi:Ferritin [Corynebacterium occultum]|uniref:Ferritin n=1 Tax=Corynebacterium occultum TaxID=2675219 RepID=A0A6B8W886_9CORY|nr:ferritin [Corynebacterium occultum]QGU08167.1 Ferritin [Corynebacterium occultum]
MTIHEEFQQALNEQISAELEASLVYLQLSYALDDLGLVGMRDWMKAQYKEEQQHAARFAEHLLDRDVLPQIGNISAPIIKIESAVEAFEAAFNHEKMISERIRRLAELQITHKDYDSRPLIDWFLQEQIQEEATIDEILDRLKIVGNSGSGLLRIDSELGDR